MKELIKAWRASRKCTTELIYVKRVGGSLSEVVIYEPSVMFTSADIIKLDEAGFVLEQERSD